MVNKPCTAHTLCIKNHITCRQSMSHTLQNNTPVRVLLFTLTFAFFHKYSLQVLPTIGDLRVCDKNFHSQINSTNTRLQIINHRPHFVKFVAVVSRFGIAKHRHTRAYKSPLKRLSQLVPGYGLEDRTSIPGKGTKCSLTSNLYGSFSLAVK